MVLAGTVFGISLAGIGALFYLKHLELRRTRAITPVLRERADEYALDLKDLLTRSKVEASKLPPLMVLISRFAVREIALRMAALLRAGEHQAHHLADMVSYKHRFEKRETRSEFLKQVSEHKNGNGIQHELETKS